MRVLAVEEYGVFVGARRGMVVVRRGKEKIAEVSPANLDYVILGTRGVSVSLDFMELMVRHAVPVFLASHGKPLALLTPFTQRHSVEAVKAQVKAQHSSLGAGIAARLVYAKIMNQARLLRRHADNAPRPRALLEAAAAIAGEAEKALSTSADSPGDARPRLMALEASAARLYWEAYAQLVHPGWGFKGRVKKGACDPVNMALNYMYALLASHTWISIIRAGLDPWIGILHADSQRRPALVYDLVEPFRQPAVDHVAARIYRREPSWQPGECRLPKQERAILQKEFWRGMEKTVRVGGQRMELRDAVLYHARLVARTLLGEAEYRPFTWR